MAGYHGDKWERKRGDDGAFLPIPVTTPEQRFWEYARLFGPIPEHCPWLGECWEWGGTPNDQGYGLIRIDGVNVRVHRWVYERVYGKLPKTLKVLHLCDNPICFRPTHLRKGTQAENLKDMRDKGRGRIPPPPPLGPRPLIVVSVCLECGLSEMTSRTRKYCSDHCYNTAYQRKQIIMRSQ